MKNLLIATLLITFTASCSKDDCKEPVINCVEGTLRYSSPAVDGVGWYLQLNDTSSQWYMIQEASIPANIKIDGTKIETCLQETNVLFHHVMMPFPSDDYYWKIISAKKK